MSKLDLLYRHRSPGPGAPDLETLVRHGDAALNAQLERSKTDSWGRGVQCIGTRGGEKAWTVEVGPRMRKIFDSIPHAARPAFYREMVKAGAAIRALPDAQNNDS